MASTRHPVHSVKKCDFVLSINLVLFLSATSLRIASDTNIDDAMMVAVALTAQLASRMSAT
ncbi:hypothetical protein [Aeromonas australiensis]|uniref:hypothetical protein n=1 Tax=Aeromonas australiensis TaxID=1114880 RepID=UPI000589BAC5|nr:hypothetical protein [Aeromonas australiensis]